MKDAEVVLGQLEETRAETLRLLEALTQEQLDWHPLAADGKEEWSLLSHSVHVSGSMHHAGARHRATCPGGFAIDPIPIAPLCSELPRAQARA
jgi:hypothetical protein